MEELELVLEVLERGLNHMETLGFLNDWVVIIDLKVLNENEPGLAGVLNNVVFEVELLLFVDVVVVVMVLSESFDGVVKVRPRNWVDSVAELVVKVPNFL